MWCGVFLFVWWFFGWVCWNFGFGYWLGWWNDGVVYEFVVLLVECESGVWYVVCWVLEWLVGGVGWCVGRWFYLDGLGVGVLGWLYWDDWNWVVLGIEWGWGYFFGIGICLFFVLVFDLVDFVCCFGVICFV